MARRIGARRRRPRRCRTRSITAEQRAFWSFQPLKKPMVAGGVAWQLGEERYRSFRAGAAREGRADAGQGRGQADAHPPRDARSHGPAADVRGDRGVREGLVAGAFAKVVDRLLASPQYGERWGRYWLDVARYGEDDPRSLDPEGRGYAPYPNAYLYRDWVVKAFNDDLPYDQFIKAQLAGDLLDERTRAQDAAGARAAGPRPLVLRQRLGRRSRTPTSATIASTSCRAASSA